MIKIFFLFFLLVVHHLSYAFILNKENPVEYYTNNEKPIQELEQKLKIGKIVGITGISGIGKSEITRQYVKKYSQEYEIIVFFDANIDLNSQFASLAKEINLRMCPKEKCIKESINSAKEGVMNYLKDKEKWLLIFDNLHVNENDKIKDIIEWKHNGHIIVCSQDDKNLLHKIPVPFLSKEHARELIKKIMVNPSNNFTIKLTNALDGNPTYILAHSAIFLQNNNYITMEEYINYMKNNDNKTREHLNLVLNQLDVRTKDLLFKLALLNNQRIPKWLIEEIIDNQAILPDMFKEMTRFGIIEQISEDRDYQIFRIHDAIKNELLDFAGEQVNKNNTDHMIMRLHNRMPKEMVNKFFKIGNDADFESNLEVLLNNAEKHKANILGIMELRNDLLGYYLRSREPFKTKMMVEWFKANKDKLNIKDMREEEKVSYSRYLGRIGRYEYFTANQPVEVVMRHLEEARELIDTLSGNEGAKTSVYYEAFQIQIFIGDIEEAKNNLERIERIMATSPNLSHKSSMIDYGKARIFLAQGNYSEALAAITLMIEKELSQLTKSKASSNKIEENATLEQEGAWLAPIYTLKAEILNYLKEFQLAYDISKKVYGVIKNRNLEEITSSTLAYNLTELSRAELGLKLIKEALIHSEEAVNILIQDQERNNQDIDNSTDIFLASALVVKGEALHTLGRIDEAISNYKLAKNIYWNIYEPKNLKQMDNVSYLLSCLFRACHDMSAKEESRIERDYYYQLHVKLFGENHHRSLQIKDM
jgi:tetratricopeptide (TPR) repeat protein